MLVNNNEWPRAVTTASIWISIGFALGFGLFKMNFSGASAFPLLLTLTIFMMVGGVLATLIVWRAKSLNNDSDRKD